MSNYTPVRGIYFLPSVLNNIAAPSSSVSSKTLESNSVSKISLYKEQQIVSVRDTWVHPASPETSSQQKKNETKRWEAQCSLQRTPNTRRLTLTPVHTYFNTSGCWETSAHIMRRTGRNRNAIYYLLLILCVVGVVLDQKVARSGRGRGRGRGHNEKQSVKNIGQGWLEMEIHIGL